MSALPHVKECVCAKRASYRVHMMTDMTFAIFCPCLIAFLHAM